MTENIFLFIPINPCMHFEKETDLAFELYDQPMLYDRVGKVGRRWCGFVITTPRTIFSHQYL